MGAPPGGRRLLCSAGRGLLIGSGADFWELLSLGLEDFRGPQLLMRGVFVSGGGKLLSRL